MFILSFLYVCVYVYIVWFEYFLSSECFIEMYFIVPDRARWKNSLVLNVFLPCINIFEKKNKKKICYLWNGHISLNPAIPFEGNAPVIDGLPHEGQAMWSFDVVFDARLNAPHDQAFDLLLILAILPLQNVGWNYQTIPKLIECNRWSLGIDDKFYLTLHQACDYLFMQKMKLNQISKRGLMTLDFSMSNGCLSLYY